MTPREQRLIKSGQAHLLKVLAGSLSSDALTSCLHDLVSIDTQAVPVVADPAYPQGAALVEMIKAAFHHQLTCLVGELAAAEAIEPQLVADEHHSAMGCEFCRLPANQPEDSFTCPYCSTRWLLHANCPSCGSVNDYRSEHGDELIAQGMQCQCGSCGRDYLADAGQLPREHNDLSAAPGTFG